MEIEFTLAPADKTAFLKHHERFVKQKGRGLWRSLLPLLLWLLFCIAFGLTIIMMDQLSQATRDRISFVMDLLPGCIVGFIGAIFLLTWFRKVAFVNMEKAYRDERTRWSLGPKRVTISPDGLSSATAYSRGFTSWGVIWAIRATKSHLFLYDTTVSGQVIPRRAFRDPQHFEEFVALCRQYKKGPTPTGIVTSLPPDGTAIFRPDKE